jgi:hypothetical protein
MSWIPIREALPDDARVLSIADRLDIHPAHALGLCVTFWALASQQTADGRLERWTTGMIDRKVGQPGFAEAMLEVEWLERDQQTLVIPRWDRYMSQASKARLQHARAQAKSAAAKRAPGTTGGPESTNEPQPTAADDHSGDGAEMVPTAAEAPKTPLRQDADGRSSAKHQQRVRSASPKKEKRREEKKSGGGAFARTPREAGGTPTPL